MRLSLKSADRLSATEAEELLTDWLSSEGTVTPSGWIDWPSFTRWPDPLLLRLMAKVLVSELSPAQLARYTPDEVGVVGVGETGLVLAAFVADELAEQCLYDRPPVLLPVKQMAQDRAFRQVGGKVELAAGKRGDGKRFKLELPAWPEGKRRWLKAGVLVTDIMASGATVSAARSLVLENHVSMKLFHLVGVKKADQEKVLYRYEIKEPVYAALELRKVERDDWETMWFKTRFLPPFGVPFKGEE